MKKISIGILTAAVLAALIILANSMYTTAENEYTVVKQFGKIVSTNSTAGLRFKTPFVQSVSTVSKAKQVYDLPQSEAITSDKKTMLVDAYVLWHVTDAKTYTSSLNASASTAQGRIDVIVYNAIKTTISSMTQEELIASRDTAVKIEATEAELDDVEINDLGGEDETESTDEVDVIIISDRLLACVGTQCEQYGIEITDIKIKVLDLPDENKEAVYNRMITERNNIAAAYRAQGESEAQVIRNTTDAEVTVMLSEAQATADATIAEGEAEYMRILSEAYNDEGKADFYTFSLELDAVRESLTGGNTTLFLDKDSPIAQIFDGV
jgi:membrane protease subunit HflC